MNMLHTAGVDYCLVRVNVDIMNSVVRVRVSFGCGWFFFFGKVTGGGKEFSATSHRKLSE